MSITARSASRKPKNKAGLIQVSGREHTVVLRDVSKVGARLRPVGNPELPDRFKLIAPMEKLDVECVVIWRKGYDVGVKFEV